MCPTYVSCHTEENGRKWKISFQFWIGAFAFIIWSIASLVMLGILGVDEDFPTVIANGVVFAAFDVLLINCCFNFRNALLNSIDLFLQGSNFVGCWWGCCWRWRWRGGLLDVATYYQKLLQAHCNTSWNGR
jgi:hypothetical protein